MERKDADQDVLACCANPEYQYVCIESSLIDAIDGGQSAEDAMVSIVDVGE